jgi:regulator of sigma E protease
MEWVDHILNILSKPVSAIVILSVLVFVHELGHFLVAKLCGVGVLEFAIGFGKKLISQTWGDTQYAIRMIPLGGFVRMVGDDPLMRIEGFPSEEDQTISEREKNLLKDKSKWFLEKGFWPRAAIVISGPAFNILFALLLTIFARWHYGEMVPVDEPRIALVQDGSPAQKAGILEKDTVRSINGEAITTWTQLADIVAKSDGKELVFEISRQRDGAAPENRTIHLTAIADSSDEAVLDGKPPKFRIGVGADYNFVPISFIDSVTSGVEVVSHLTVMVFRGIWGMVRGAISPKNISGPLFIFKEAAASASRGAEHVIQFMVFLSISLAVLNLLPIPILDGGHLLMFVIEAIKGRPLSIKFYAIANQIGMFILLFLMVFAFSNDIGRFLGAS